MADPGLTFPTPEFAVGAVALAELVIDPVAPTGLELEELEEEVAAPALDVVLISESVALLLELLIFDDVADATSTVVCDPSGAVYTPV